MKKKDYFSNFFLNWPEKFYRLRKFDKTVDKNRRLDWWDYQWDFARYIHSGLAIVPTVNLIRNLGFGATGTHTKNEKSRSAQLQAGNISLPLRHPPFILRDMESDSKYFQMFMRDIVVSGFKI